MRPASRRRLLVVLLALTVAAAVADLAGGPGVSQVRAAGGAVFGPLERVASLGERAGRSATGTRAESEAVRDALQRDERATSDGDGQQLDRLLGAPDLAGRSLLVARVVAVGRQGAAGPERVTIDVGARDGIRPDLAVVDADGLVGRVVAVAPWTSDVLLIGSADLVVGIRVGSAGTLGSVGSGARGPHRRAAGLLNLSLVQRGAARRGDAVTTLGSVGEAPFPAGLRVGAVAAVDDAPGALAPTAAVQPAVEVTTLDLVAVITTTPRTAPRVAVTGGR